MRVELLKPPLRWRVKLQWEPRDAWIGVYWTHAKPWVWGRYHGIRALKIYICLLPFLPIVFYQDKKED